MSGMTYSLSTDGMSFGTAEVVPMDEGDLLVSLRDEGVHPDHERAIIRIAKTPHGFDVTVLNGGSGDFDEIGVEKEQPS